MRTTDLSYSADYWNSLDSGAGYQDSVMWADIAHAVAETVFYDKKAGVDRAGEYEAVDVGCAYGFLIRHLRSRGCEAWGLEFSQYAIGQAPEDVRDYIRPFDLTVDEPCFFGDDKFGLVTCFETLEHIPLRQSEQAVQNLWRMMKPGGVGIFTICVEGQPNPYDDPTHVNVNKPEFWVALFARRGFVLDGDTEEDIKRFWLFSQHKGVFVVRKPAC
jgi:SAM-dependent methyltransferase